MKQSIPAQREHRQDSHGAALGPLPSWGKRGLDSACFSFVFLASLAAQIPFIGHARADTQISHLLTARWAFGIETRETQLSELRYEPELNWRGDEGTGITALARLSLQPVDGLRSLDVSRSTYAPASRPGVFGDFGKLELREFYYQSDWGESYLRIGKQQVVWGQADGLKLLDAVNPQSFREFILEDFDDSRIPRWTLNLERSLGDWSLQFLWLPDPTYHALPNPGATYAFSSPRLVPKAPPGVPVTLREADRPSHALSDSDVGLRLGAFVGGWDLSLNWLYQYHPFPVLYQRLELSPAGPRVLLEPGYERTHLLGGSLSNAFGDWVLRAEIGWLSDRYFLTNDRNDRDGVARSPELAYVIGLDWSGLDDSFVSVQWFQSRLLEHRPGMTREAVDSTVTALIRRDFLNETLVAELMWLTNLNDGDGLLRPKISYEWDSNLRVWTGLDLFYGDADGLFGQFDDTDRWVAGIEIGF